MAECLSRQGGIRICQLGDPSHMIDPINVLRNPSRSDVPIVVLEHVEVDERNGDVPVFAVGRVCCGVESASGPPSDVCDNNRTRGD